MFISGLFDSRNLGMIPARCAFGNDSFIFYVEDDMGISEIRKRIFQRWNLNGPHWCIKYQLPGEVKYDICLNVNDDIEVMRSLHKNGNEKYVLMQVACKERCTAVRSSGQSGPSTSNCRKMRMYHVRPITCLENVQNRRIRKCQYFRNGTRGHSV
ncbi:hypothetical protein Taro_017127 [Colocasia esculenta]|uniref:PB1 domain-containing protein n=1 Tax=Colocasia esculenta TaxID=4460 RepID=A0A843USE8_COLES|nr:hypothetical protein [Colocasia esculenta]